MMKYLRTVLLLSAFSTLSQAQVTPTGGGESGLQIVNFKWAKHRRMLVSFETGMPGAENRVAERLGDFSIDRDAVAYRLGRGGRSGYAEELRRLRQLRLTDNRYYYAPPNRLAWSPSDRPANPNWTGYSYMVEVLNKSGKKIEAVEWDYLFVEPDTGKELLRYRFRSKVDIDPAKKKKVRAYTNGWPVALVYAKKEGGRESESVEVKRITYSDGSTWER